MGPRELLHRPPLLTFHLVTAEMNKYPSQSHSSELQEDILDMWRNQWKISDQMHIYSTTGCLFADGRACWESLPFCHWHPERPLFINSNLGEDANINAHLLKLSSTSGCNMCTCFHLYTVHVCKNRLDIFSMNFFDFSTSVVMWQASSIGKDFFSSCMLGNKK